MGDIIRTEYSELMQKAYIDYAMSVIISRALPDARDGLKPVQRRTLFDMQKLGITWDKPYRKSARIVGDTMGKYHPHGDSSIYDALVVMAQEFKKGQVLVDGHGNFGSIEGDGAAAMRYTEARLEKITQEVYLRDLDKNTVDFVPNFDETEKEPEVLPVRIPNLLVNGSDGIAVGMATSIPPHNLGEVIDAAAAYIRDEKITTKALMKYIKGPDFPTGGIVVNQKELLELYEKGTGKIRIRGRVQLEKGKGGKKYLVITEIPYPMVGANIGKFLNDVAHLVETRQASEITDISNQSSKEGIRIVLELRKDADPERLENLLYKKTRLEDTFGVNMLAVYEGRPETMSLRQVLECFADFQFSLTTRKYQTLLKKEQENREVQEGLIKAVDVIDLIIEILRGSQNQSQARACLIKGETGGIHFRTKKSLAQAKKLRFTERQAQAILDMRLARLIGLELEALYKENEATKKKIDEYEDILNHYDSMVQVILRDLAAIKKEYAKKRKTKIIEAEPIVLQEEKEADLPVVFLMDRFGYARVVDPAVYERNKEAADKENRFVFRTGSLGKVVFFTDTGMAHLIKAKDLPQTKFRDKGVPIDNLSNYSSAEERILYAASLEELIKGQLIFVTQKGMVKTVPGSEFDVRRNSVLATKLAEDGDRLLFVGDPEAGDHLVLRSHEGYFLKFPVSEIPEKRKTALGVRGMRLSENDLLEEAWLLVNRVDLTIQYHEKEVSLNRLRSAKRDQKGTRIRI